LFLGGPPASSKGRKRSHFVKPIRGPGTAFQLVQTKTDPKRVAGIRCLKTGSGLGTKTFPRELIKFREANDQTEIRFAKGRCLQSGFFFRTPTPRKNKGGRDGQAPLFAKSSCRFLWMDQEFVTCLIPIRGQINPRPTAKGGMVMLRFGFARLNFAIAHRDRFSEIVPYRGDHESIVPTLARLRFSGLMMTVL